jgi:hypothetical protein
MEGLGLLMSNWRVAGNDEDRLQVIAVPPRLAWPVLKSKQRTPYPISAAEKPDCVSLGTQNKERLNSLFHPTYPRGMMKASLGN